MLRQRLARTRQCRAGSAASPRALRQAFAFARAGETPAAISLRHPFLRRAASRYDARRGSIKPMAFEAGKPFGRLLDPIDRISEVLFGLIMVLTSTNTISAATAG